MGCLEGHRLFHVLVGAGRRPCYPGGVLTFGSTSVRHLYPGRGRLHRTHCSERCRPAENQRPGRGRLVGSLVFGARSLSGARSASVSGARLAVSARESGVRPGPRSAAECAVEARWPGLRLVGRGGHSPSSRSGQDVGVLTGAWAWARWALRASRCWA